MAKFVVVPFAAKTDEMTIDPSESIPDLETENERRTEHIKQIRSEWKNHISSPKKVVVPGGKAKLNAKNGDTIYIHAHGYSDDGGEIGCDCGIAAATPNQLLDRLIALGLNAATRDLKIKVFACFSGFGYAKALYDAIVARFPLATQFTGLTVDGYTGSTRATIPKLVKQRTITKTGKVIAPWVKTSEQTTEQDVLAKTARQRNGPKPG